MKHLLLLILNCTLLEQVPELTDLLTSMVVTLWINDSNDKTRNSNLFTTYNENSKKNHDQK